MSPARTPRPFPWAPLTLADAYAPRPPTRWVVDGILRTASLNVLYGPPGCLKSLLAADLCACVAGGKPWLAPRPGQPGAGIPVTQGRALLLDFDNGAETTLARLEAVGRGHGLTAAAPLFAVSMPTPWLDLTDLGNVRSPDPRSHADMLADFITNCSASLVLIDNLGTVSGAADENSAEMVQILGALRRVAETTGAALVVIHHQRKASGTTTHGRAGDTLRGHSSIEAALDLALLVKRDGDLLTIEATKTRGADLDPLGALWTFDFKPGTHDLQAARFYRDAPQISDPNAAIRAAVMDALLAGPLNQSALFTAVKQQEPKASLERVRRALVALVSRGIVAEQKSLLKNAILYSLMVQP